MNIRDKRKMVTQLIEKLDEKRLDALITLLKDPQDELIVSESDWEYANYRRKLYEEGNAETTPADNVIKNLKKSLGKRK